MAGPHYSGKKLCHRINSLQAESPDCRIHGQLFDVSQRPNYEQLYAQALSALRAGEKTFFDAEQTRALDAKAPRENPSVTSSLSNEANTNLIARNNLSLF